MSTAPDTPTLPPWIEPAILDALADALAERIAPRVIKLVGEAKADPWISSRQAAAYLDIHYSTLKERAAAGELPGHQDTPSGPLKFKRSELDDWRRSNG